MLISIPIRFWRGGCRHINPSASCSKASALSICRFNLQGFTAIPLPMNVYFEFRPICSVNSVLTSLWVSLQLQITTKSLLGGKKPVRKKTGPGSPLPPPQILRNLWGSAGWFCRRVCERENLLKNPYTEPQKFCRTLGPKPACSDPANSSPKKSRRH